MSDKIVDFEEYQKNKEKTSRVTIQEDAEDIMEKSKPLTKRDIIQLDLIESLAEHVHYLTNIIDRLLEENKNLKEKLDSKV